MKKILIGLVSALLFATGVSAQKTDVLGVGARFGMASFMQETQDWNWKVGFNTLADVQYAHYFGTIDSKGSQWGLRTGLSLGYMQSSIAAPVTLQFNAQDELGGNVLYTVTSSEVKETDRQLFLEVPLMVEFTFWRMYAGAGLKAGIPVWSRYTQRMADLNIDAYYEDFDVHVTNEVVTGAAAEEDKVQTKKWNGSNINLSVTGEIGYLFELKNGNSLGIGLYADYTFWNNYKNENPSALVDVETGAIDPVSGAGAAVHVTNLTDAYVDKLGYFDFGIKVSYNFNLKK